MNVTQVYNFDLWGLTPSWIIGEFFASLSYCYKYHTKRKTAKNACNRITFSDIQHFRMCHFAHFYIENVWKMGKNHE